MTQPTEPTATAAQLRKDMQKEWGTYIATGPIDIDGVRAFNTSDPVPVSHVTGGVVGEDQVAKVETKTGQAAIAAAAESTTTTPPLETAS